MRYEVAQLSEGWAGTDQTVAKINEIVAASLTDPIVVQTARGLVRHLPERDKDAEIEAVSRFVRGKIRYTNEAVETLSTPRVLLDEIRRFGRAVGDCDDHVILWMALHRALGNRVRVKVISQRKNGIANHIYGQVFSPRRGWITDELIVKHRPLGWEVPAREVTKAKIYEASVGELGMRHETGSGMGWHRRRGTRRVVRKEDDFFTPGGAAMAVVDPFAAHNKRMVSQTYRPDAYRIKTGGALHVERDGSLKGMGGVGFFPALLAAAMPLLTKKGPGLISKFGKFGKKPKAAPAPAPAAAQCPPGYMPSVSDYLQVGDFYEAGMGQT